MTYISATQGKEIPLAGWAREIKPSALQEMLSVISSPNVLSFALGLPAAELFPTEQLAKAATDVLASDPASLQYNVPFQPLKEQIVALMAQRQVTCNEQQVFLTAGAQQGMSLLSHLLLDKGGQVILEEFAYTGFQQVIEPYQPRILTVSTDLESGVDIEAVESILSKDPRSTIMYAVTDGHNPLGISMALETRVRLVELARKYHMPIIEDDAYGFLYYNQAPIPPLRALDDQWVYYVGSFSKVLAPALRVGWLIVPEALIPKLAIVKESSDINASTFSQRVISAYLKEDHLTSALNELRQAYRARRDAMVRALHERFPSEASWKQPQSGVFIWAELPTMANMEEVLRIAIEKEKVAFIPGHAFCVNKNRRGINCMRLNFSHCPVEKIDDGITRLAKVLNDYLATRVGA